MLAYMRATSTAALPDTCTITRDGIGEPTLDTVTGVTTEPTRSPVYSGACRLRPAEGQETDTEVGGLHETLGRYVLTLPYSAADVVVDDLAIVATSTDADVVSRPMRVLHVSYSANQIDRRVIVRDIEQPH
jgi:hypothetical protein